MKAYVPAALATVLACAGLTACDQSTGAAVSQTRPQVVIQKTMADVHSELLKMAMAMPKTHVISDSDSRVVFDQTVDDSVMMTAFFGSTANPNPDRRWTFTLVPENGGTRVYVDGAVVTNPGTGFEHVIYAEGSNSTDMQKSLDALAARIDGPAKP